MKNKIIHRLFVLLLLQPLKPAALEAQVSDPFFNNSHNTLCFYSIEVISNLLASSSDTSEIRIFSGNFPLAEIFSGRLDQASAKMKSYEQNDFALAAPQEQFRFLQLYSWVLSHSFQEERAVELWKKFMSGQNDLQLQTKAVNELCRIYNDVGKPHKALLLLSTFHQPDIDSDQIETAFESTIELSRSYLLMADTLNSYRQLIMADELLSQHTHLPFADRLILLNLKNILNDTNTYSLIQDIKDQLNKQNAALKSIALQLLALQPGVAVDTVFDLLFRSGKEWELHQEQIARMSPHREVSNRSSEKTVVPVKRWKEAGITLQTATWLMAILVFFLITLIFKSYFRFIKTIRIKSEQIHEHRFQVEQDMHESFRKVDELVAQREANLHTELQERDKVDSELKEALQQTESANFEKNTFLSNLSHEIRTPLNGIIGFSSLLENELAMLDQPELFDYANSIQRSGEKLLHLLNNIIDISRLEANDIEFNLAPCPVKDIADETIRLFAAPATEKGIRLVSEITDLRALADAEMLARVFFEILDNAVKFTEKGFVRITITNDTDPLFIQIRVRDTGIGIDPNYLPGLFEAYRRESSGYSRQYQGAALGIPVSRQLVERMSGSFIIESEKAVGTTVIIRLPIVPAQKPGKAEITSRTDNVLLSQIQDVLGGKKILIIESDLETRKTMASFFNEVGEVHTASNGAEALNMIRKQAAFNLFFSLIITDIHLQPPWDGIKLIQTVRSGYPAYQQVNIIGISAFDISGKANILEKEGFSSTLRKPVSQRKLFRQIHELFYNKSI